MRQSGSETPLSLIQPEGYGSSASASILALIRVTASLGRRFRSLIAERLSFT